MFPDLVPLSAIVWPTGQDALLQYSTDGPIPRDSWWKAILRQVLQQIHGEFSRVVVLVVPGQSSRNSCRDFFMAAAKGRP